MRSLAGLGTVAGAGTVAGVGSDRRRTGSRRSDEPARYFPAGPRVSVSVVGSGLTAPTDMAATLPPDGRTFVADQPGSVHVLDATGVRDVPFIDVRDRLVGAPGEPSERGLLGLEFHPEFARNRRFFLHYSAPPRAGTPPGYDHTEVISEFRAAADLSRGRPATERTLLEIPHPFSNHNAGPMAFGPDGYLYVPMGDGGGSGDSGHGHARDWYERNGGGNGQDVDDNLLGSVLRLDVDDARSGTPYAIPEDNPLVGTSGRDELYAWGFRNPWRLSFDDRGRLFVGDVGEASYEEVSVVEKGGNYGWNVREGTHCFDAEDFDTHLDRCPRSTPDGEPLRSPILEYPHEYDGRPVGRAVIGGYFVEPAGGRGVYVFGDYARDPAEPSGRLFAAVPPAVASPPAGSPQRTIPNEPIWYAKELRVGRRTGDGLGYYLRGIGRGADDELYLLGSRQLGPTGDTGTVLRLDLPRTIGKGW